MSGSFTVITRRLAVASLLRDYNGIQTWSAVLARRELLTYSK